MQTNCSTTQAVHATAAAGNPWITAEPIPLALTVEYIAEGLRDLEEWTRVTGRPLPRPAHEILAAEMAGNVVDLMTGEIFRPPDPPVVWEVGS